MGYRKLGLAFCLGLASEARIVDRFLSESGFDVISVICKAGGLPKESIGIQDSQKIRPGQRECICNPVLQAKAMNRAGTEFNIVLGLCVGHDSMFFRFSQAPCTVLAVKDRISGHNPLASVYTMDSYSKYLMNEET